MFYFAASWFSNAASADMAAPVELVNLRAVKSFLRNFRGDQRHASEIISIMVCYGIECLARNAQLKGMTVAELRDITKFKKTQTKDYYVSSTNLPESLRSPADAVVFRKPPRAWRAGDEDHISGRIADATDNAPAELDATSLSGMLCASKNERSAYYQCGATDVEDPADHHRVASGLRRMIGDKLCNTLVQTYTGRHHVLLEDDMVDAFATVDSLKQPSWFEVPSMVSTLNEFAEAYVTHCIRAHSCQPPSVSSNPPPPPQPFERQANIDSSSITSSKRSKSVDVAAVPTQRTRTKREEEGIKVQDKPSRSRTSETQSRIKDVVSADKNKLLRVKKTQTQLMKEALARARLAEYDRNRRHEEQASALSIARHKKMPLDKITPGAAALEIVDDFIKSPLMDSFCNGVDSSPRRVDKAFEEEIYGKNTPRSCQAPPRQPLRSMPDRQKRHNYNGWLGDFGPAHTKTVRPEWNDSEEDSPRSNGAKPPKGWSNRFHYHD
ncbi:TPA: hypothetical protein N0F65_011402 [Lagenidium giganteum]|uniref:Uncharacterized protein n=1 Tax=Lagenidium giganteum TaxID=4803 RepID=A0AAV2ZB14_9STRA|nr:TPA: hypothetical protein N0F65_011402 [Lagenidium giganteum]